MTARHDGVQVSGFRAFQFKGRDDLILACICVKVTQGKINRTTGNAIFPGDGPGIPVADGLIPKYTHHNVLGERGMNGNLILLQEQSTFDTLFPVFKQGQVFFGNDEGMLP